MQKKGGGNLKGLNKYSARPTKKIGFGHWSKTKQMRGEKAAKNKKHRKWPTQTWQGNSRPKRAMASKKEGGKSEKKRKLRMTEVCRGSKGQDKCIGEWQLTTKVWENSHKN